MEDLVGWSSIHAHFAPGSAFLGWPSSRCRRCSFHVSRLPRRKHSRNPARFAHCRRKAHQRSERGGSDAGLSTRATVWRRGKALRRDCHLAPSSPRKTVSRGKTWPTLDAFHTAQRMGRSRPFSTERIRRRAKIGPRVQPLLLEVRYQRKSSSLSGRVGFSLCPERRRTGPALSIW